MDAHGRRVLLLYTDPYYLIKQVYPFGLDAIAAACRAGGHTVTLEYPFLPDSDLESNLRAILGRSEPEVIGLGIRNLDTCMACEPHGTLEGEGYRTFYFLPEIEKIAIFLRRHSPGVPLVLGGGGFSISPESIVKRLAAPYGVVGEGEQAFLQFLDAFPDRERMAAIPGLIFWDGYRAKATPRKWDGVEFMERGFQRDNKFQYAFAETGLPVRVKRGCNQKCSYCVEPLIEGGRIRYRNMGSVVEELKGLAASCPEPVQTIFFVDTEFNIPDLSRPSELIRRIVSEGLHERFRFASQFLPRPFDMDFGNLLAEAGFSVILTCDSFSDGVLHRNRVSYREKDIQRTLEVCEKTGVKCTVSLIFGLPGETYATVDHTVSRMQLYAPNAWRRYEYTVGGRIYQGTALSHWAETPEARDCIYGARTPGWVAPCYYCTPAAPLALKAYIEERLGYGAAYQNRVDPSAVQALGSVYVADQGRWEEACHRFLRCDLKARSAIYDDLFRRFADAGRRHEARAISENLLKAILKGPGGDSFRDQADLIRFYMNCLGM